MVILCVYLYGSVPVDESAAQIGVSVFGTSVASVPSEPLTLLWFQNNGLRRDIGAGRKTEHAIQLNLPQNIVGWHILLRNVSVASCIVGSVGENISGLKDSQTRAIGNAIDVTVKDVDGRALINLPDNDMAILEAENPGQLSLVCFIDTYPAHYVNATTKMLVVQNDEIGSNDIKSLDFADSAKQLRFDVLPNAEKDSINFSFQRGEAVEGRESSEEMREISPGRSVLFSWESKTASVWREFLSVVVIAVLLSLFFYAIGEIKKQNESSVENLNAIEGEVDKAKP